MNRRLAGALVAVLLLLGALALVLVLRRGNDGDRPLSGTPAAIEASPRERVETSDATIYFPDERGTLSPEQRALAATTSAEERARALLEAVLAGPGEPGHVAPFPAGTGLGTIHLTPGGVLYVDLVSSEHPRPPAQGSLEEMLSIFSVVNTVLLDESGIQAVVLLWNGRQPDDFSGHVDTSLPLRADRDLLARGA